MRLAKQPGDHLAENARAGRGRLVGQIGFADRRPGRRPWDSAASGGFCRHLSAIISNSRSARGLSSRGGSGSCSSTNNTVSTGEAAWNGGRPVSIWYRIVPRL